MFAQLHNLKSSFLCALGLATLLSAKFLSATKGQRHALQSDEENKDAGILSATVSINLTGNVLRRTDIQNLSRCLSSRQITSLDLSDTEIDDDHIMILAPCLAKNECITSLALSENTFSCKGAEILAKALSNTKSLKNLNLQGMKIDATVF